LQGGVKVLGSGRAQPTLAGAYQAALDKANAANEARYQQLMTGYDDLGKRVQGTLADVGTQEFRDIDREYRNMGSDVYQRLVNRGFANSTLPATQQMGVTRERSSARSRLASQLAQQKANYDAQITQGKFGVMERRNDVGPDPAQMIALSQGLGQAGYGQGLGPGGAVGMGQPIGITPDQYQMSYMQGLQRHFGGIGGFGYQRPAPTQARMRSQANRQLRYLQRLMQAQQPQAPAAPPAQRPPAYRTGYQPGPGGLRSTQPGPWSSGYNRGPVLPGNMSPAGPWRSGYQQPVGFQPRNDFWDFPAPYGVQ